MKNALMMLVLLCGMVSSAFGGVSEVQFLNMGPSETSHIWGGGHTNLYVYSGVLNLNVNDQPVPGFCVDLTKGVSSRSTSYRPISVEEYLGAGKAAYFTDLYTTYYTNNWTNAQASAFQLAVWEIVYEQLPKNSGMYDVTIDGSAGQGFFCTSSSSGMANSWLHLLDGSGPRVPVTILLSDSYQNFAVAIPEPATCFLVLSGLPLLIGRTQIRRWLRVKA